ncbi:type II toxin-antitoxin system PemK/MazF family toxin [Dactylosporangium sp. NPDC051541]|uniref:type II toxin-antitoxin system PemK/MazF family toxin n=1 Tax=Dactylosporangium sp. NPDC051541 TaxID=3363977 RepID=UPI00378AAD8E
MTAVRTGEIWLADLDPTVGHEQGGRRPVVVMSSNAFHALPINMVMVVPLTSHDRGLVTQPRISGAQSGLRQASFARPEDMRSVDAGRLQRRLGQVGGEDLAEIRKVVRYFLDL